METMIFSPEYSATVPQNPPKILHENTSTQFSAFCGKPHLFITQTALSKRYRISTFSMGLILKELGLRDSDGLPTQLALEKNLFVWVIGRENTQYPLWNHLEIGRILFNSGINSQRLKEMWASKKSIKKSKSDQSSAPQSPQAHP